MLQSSLVIALMYAALAACFAVPFGILAGLGAIAQDEGPGGAVVVVLALFAPIFYGVITFVIWRSPFCCPTPSRG